MSEEILTADERKYALNREDTWRKYKIQIERDYEKADDKSSVVNAAQLYIYENESSLDPIIKVESALTRTF